MNFLNILFIKKCTYTRSIIKTNDRLRVSAEWNHQDSSNIMQINQVANRKSICLRGSEANNSPKVNQANWTNKLHMHQSSSAPPIWYTAAGPAMGTRRTPGDYPDYPGVSTVMLLSTHRWRGIHGGVSVRKQLRIFKRIPADVRAASSPSPQVHRNERNARTMRHLLLARMLTAIQIKNYSTVASKKW